MKAADRARTILRYLADNEVAGTPSVIHNNLKLYRDANWSRDTTKRRLFDFTEVGLVEHLPDIGRNGYYRISNEGQKRLIDGISNDEYNEIIGSAGYSFDNTWDG